jgi:hypothetical protein
VGLLIGRSRNCNVPVRDNVDGVIDQNLNLQYLLSWFWEGILVTSSFCDITITIFLSTSTGVRKNQYFSRTGSSISTIYGSTGTNKEKREKKGILMESCMPDYILFIYFINLTLCRRQFSLPADAFTCTSTYSTDTA